MANLSSIDANTSNASALCAGRSSISWSSRHRQAKVPPPFPFVLLILILILVVLFLFIFVSTSCFTTLSSYYGDQVYIALSILQASELAFILHVLRQSSMLL